MNQSQVKRYHRHTGPNHPHAFTRSDLLVTLALLTLILGFVLPAQFQLLIHRSSP